MKQKQLRGAEKSTEAIKILAYSTASVQLVLI